MRRFARGSGGSPPSLFSNPQIPNLFHAAKHCEASVGN
ncbi:predicted protein [Botrytis cinerea T4]|uniref:Uncharacterized protein n=1 Tax=Botryotinia fuckeliana (strain T4) TaxID=999810 RepID=G2YP03_BOTF4|nr:predicted protein [Botrytis cinerea T4]